MARTWMTDAQRFEPYGVYKGHPTTRENAKAGPSAQPPPPTSHDTCRRTDAGTNQQITEEAEEE